MNHSYYSITLDVKAIQSQVTLPVKQGDTTRGVYISFVDGGEAYIIEGDCFAVFKGEKSDGSELGNYCTIEDNKIIYPFTPETVSSPGVIACEVSLYNTKEELITSARFSIFVDSRLVGSENYKSSSEYTILEEYLAEVKRNEEARQNALATVIDENSTHEQYASAQATYEYGQKVKNELIESVDTELDENSENPVQNKAIVNYLTEILGAIGEELERLDDEIDLKVSTFDRTAYGDLEAKKEDHEAVPTVPAMLQYVENYVKEQLGVIDNGRY
jgi:hypothetical protein